MASRLGSGDGTQASQETAVVGGRIWPTHSSLIVKYQEQAKCMRRLKSFARCSVVNKLDAVELRGFVHHISRISTCANTPW